MKKKSLFFAVAAFAGIAFSSCDEDGKSISVAPEFEEITLTPNPCQPGDSVTAVVTYKSEGKYYHYFKQEWKIGEATTTNLDKANMPTNQKPTLKFKAPDNVGTYPVSFIATLSYDSGDKLYGQSNSVSSTLKVQKTNRFEEEY